MLKIGKLRIELKKRLKFGKKNAKIKSTNPKDRKFRFRIINITK